MTVESLSGPGHAASSSLQQNWAIVGGGILGMAIAEKLSGAGAKVTIYEAEPVFGGLASAWRLDNLLWDRHYHVILLSDFHTKALLNRLGLEKNMAWVETKTGFFTGGQLYSMSNSLEFLRFPPLGLADKLRLAATIFYTSKIRNWRRLEKIPVADYLQRLSGRRTFERIWLPLLRAKLGQNYARTSAAFIWATIARMYIARQSGLKKEMFGYIPGGYGRILDRYADHLTAQDVRLVSSCPVHRLIPHKDGRILVETQTESRVFDQAVLTVPTPVAAQMCPSLPSDERAKLSDLEYQGVICASILLKRSLSPYYVTNITDSWIPFTAVIEMSALVDKEEFGGRSLVYLPKYVASDDPAFTRSDEELKNEWLAALAKMHPSIKPEDILTFNVSRMRHVHALPTLDYSTSMPPMRTSVDCIHLVNSAQIINGTTNVNETLKLADHWANSKIRRS
jgi:protoporphyrinogen oxidase